MELARASCLRHVPSAESAGNESPETTEVQKAHTAGEFLTIPDFPKASNEWGYSGTRHRGLASGFSAHGTASFRDYMAIAGEIPPQMSGGFHILPDDVGEAVRFFLGRGLPAWIDIGETSW